MGLSPYARGNRHSVRVSQRVRGPIPVCTGEPFRRPSFPALRGAYPRMHGGTSAGGSPVLAAWGLSPYARGNRAGDHGYWRDPGPIPVCTGEPASSEHSLQKEGAYPRMHGGTAMHQTSPKLSWGLSPYARGNLVVPFRYFSEQGPIPVCTGEPTTARAARTALRAYPRMHGGTASPTARRLVR